MKLQVAATVVKMARYGMAPVAGNNFVDWLVGLQARKERMEAPEGR